MVMKTSIFAILALWALPVGAIAGAWPIGEGKAQIIVSNYIPSADTALRDEIDIYSEYGVLENSSFVFSGALSDYGGGNEGKYYSIGVKRQVFDGKTKISAQLSKISNIPDKYHTSQSSYELRIMAGQNFGGGWWANGEIGINSEKDGANTNYELAFGRNLTGNSKIIAKYLSNDFIYSERVEKMQISIIRPLTKHLSWEVGVRKDFGGYDGKKNSGMFAGIWCSF